MRFFLVSDHRIAPKMAKRLLSEDLPRISVPASRTGFRAGHGKGGDLRKRVLRIGREWQRSRWTGTGAKIEASRIENIRLHNLVGSGRDLLPKACVAPRVESVPERTENCAAGKISPQGYRSTAYKRMTAYSTPD